MSDETMDNPTSDLTRDGRTAIEPTAVNSPYEFLGQLTSDTGEGVLGQNDAGDSDPEPASSGTHVDVLVSAPGQLEGGPIPANATATIWAGAVDADAGLLPVGIDNESLEVDVEQPDGTVENFSVTTDTDGTATMSYDLSASGRGNGEYTFSVTEPDTGASASRSYRVGPTVRGTSNNGAYVLQDEQATFAFLVLDGDSGLSGQSVTLTVTDSGGSQVKQTTKTTDANGFVTVSFTPTGSGESYEAEAELPSGLVESELFDVVPRLGKVPFLFGAIANPGSTNGYLGVVDTASGPLANTGVDVEFSDSNGVLATKSTTTDDRGFFAVEYDLPSGYSENFLSVSATTAGGDPIALTADTVFVSSSSSGGGSGPVLTASADSPRAPDETVTVDITAEDGGTPITNQDVEVLLRYGFGGPPAYWTTVTTDSTGSASTSFTLPSNAPDANVLDGEVAMQYDGSTYTTGTETEIERYDVQVDYTGPAPGTSETYSVEVTDAVSGDGVSGVPVQLNLSHDEGLTGSFATAGFDSGGDGTDSASVSTPSDLGFRSYFNYVHRYETQSAVTITRNDHPGTLSTSDSLYPGEDAEFSFSTPTDVTLDGIAFGTTFGEDGKSYGTRFGGSGTSRTFTLRVPPELSGGDEFSLGTWASDGSGTLYSDVAGFTADTASISLSANGESGVPVGGEATISVSADQVESITISDLWTDWTLNSSNPDGGTVTDNISSTGEVTIDYSSLTGSVSPSITVGIPSRYVGGEYGITVTATNDTGDSAEATAVVTIT